MGKLFGTDGIRGLVGQDLSPQLAFRAGLAAGEILANKEKSGKRGQVVLGRDTRISGPMLASALASGLAAMGLDVIDLGVIPTPGVAYLVRKYQADLGVVISASHNPYPYNGIKFFSSQGYKLDDRIEEQMEALILDPDWEGNFAPVEDLGQIQVSHQGKKDYEAYLLSLLEGADLSQLKIALDLGNGALYHIAKEVLTKAGAQLEVIHQEPNGLNINDACGSTSPKEIQDLVLKTGADMGFSFDGDADRIIAVDEKGRQVDGDHILAICARQLKDQGLLAGDGLVGTVMTNIGLDRYLEDLGLKIIKAKVGDRYVLEEMLAGGYVLGGEQSGHIIFLNNNTTGDGLATGLHLIKVALEYKESLGQLNDLMVSYPQVLVNAQVANHKKQAYLDNETIKEAIKALEDKFGKTGRVVIRPSGTEPLVRVMIEGQDQEMLEKEARRLADLIEKELS
ncbi:MAG: phosphoglucosamine mutase [Tissierellia bacterium]|nr:phosphoglucosamine mutase [Tissierellia bacterium]